jgi:hypothetical protein
MSAIGPFRMASGARLDAHERGLTLLPTDTEACITATPNEYEPAAAPKALKNLARGFEHLDAPTGGDARESRRRFTELVDEDEGS